MKKKSMVRKQLYIKPEQNLMLKEQAQTYGTSEGEIVRKALDDYLSTPTYSQEIDLTFWDKEVAFIKSRMKNNTEPEKPRTWKREDLYDC